MSIFITALILTLIDLSGYVATRKRNIGFIYYSGRHIPFIWVWFLIKNNR